MTMAVIRNLVDFMWFCAIKLLLNNYLYCSDKFDAKKLIIHSYTSASPAHEINNGMNDG